MTHTLHCSPNVLLVMDTLWFQHIILFSQSSSSTLSSATPKTCLDSQSDLSSTPCSLEEQMSFSSDTDTSPVSPKDDKLRDDTESSEDEKTDHNYRSNRPTTQRHVSSKTRSHSSSPQSMHKLPKHLRNNGATTSLRKTVSCRSLLDLEYEEVKGFMDLGFTFKKEQLCPRIWSVIPGLQRLDEYNDSSDNDQSLGTITESTITESKDNHVRPYLSEAWLIRRPDSPLLNLKIPKVRTPDDMKKHLKCWARTVASTVQIEY